MGKRSRPIVVLSAGVCVGLVWFADLTVVAGQAPRRPRQAPWIARSNENAQLLLNIRAKYNPENAAREGVPSLDDQVTQFPSDRRTRIKADLEDALQQFRRRLTTERDSQVAQDLRILTTAAQDMLTSQELSDKYDLLYVNVPQMIFGGVRALLDDQVPQARQRAALVRLRKYVGMEPGFEPLTKQIQARAAEWAKPGQRGPARIQAETDLARADFFVDGVADLFTRYNVEGYQEPLAKLKQQVAEYKGWVKEEILPKARDDFQLPPEQYAFLLRRIGVDIPADRLAALAHEKFAEWQNEIQQIASQVAKSKGLAATDYREVIRELKREQ